MVIEIKKRDGRIVPFDKGRISMAIIHAALSVTDDVNEDIANDLADCVTWYLNGRYDKDNPPCVEDVQDAVEKILIENGHAKTAKAYILYRAERNRTREMSMALMQTYEDLTFKFSKDMDLKRENANINTDTAMGTMLKYGSEGAKKFNHLYLLDKDVSEAHLNCDIHIHDLDFYALTETCVSGDTRVFLLDEETKEPYDVSVSEAYKLLGGSNNFDEWVNPKNILIWSDGKFVPLKGVVKHDGSNKRLLGIEIEVTRCHGKVVLTQILKVTDEHRMPIVRNGVSLLLQAGEIQIGDYVQKAKHTTDKDNLLEIMDIHELKSEDIVYDFETDNHYFSANDILVHNCCQIDLEKLFKGGFSTGHGMLREPQDIRSYAALACIAIQSNQNDQHGGQSIPAFDYYMAPGVVKTMLRELIKVLDIRYDLSDVDEFKEELNVIRVKHNNRVLNAEAKQEIKRVLIQHLNDAGIVFDNKSFENAWDKALDETKKDTHQAMEAFVHNLNSMHCLPGYEQIWVFEGKELTPKLMFIEDIYTTKDDKEYYVYSINKETGKLEVNRITDVRKVKGYKDFVNVHGGNGSKLAMTTDHRVMTMTSDGLITEGRPTDVDNLLIPRNFNMHRGTFVEQEEYAKIVWGKLAKESGCEGLEPTPALMKFLGSLVHGGYIENDAIIYTKKVVEKYTKIYNEAFLDEIIYNACGKYIVRMDYYINGGLAYTMKPEFIQFLLSILEYNGMSEDKVYMDYMYAPIFMLSNDLILEFIRGYCLTGAYYLKNRRILISFAHSYERYHVALFLSSLGVIPNFVSLIGQEDTESISITFEDAEKLGIMTNGLYKKIEKLGAYDDYVPDVLSKGYIKGYANDILSYVGSTSRVDSLSDIDKLIGVSKGIERCSRFADVSIYNEIKVEDECIDVYDITVDKNENFLTSELLLVHNCRAGAQVPFSSINYGTDTSEESRLVIKALLQATWEGLGNGETPIFPIQIFKLKDGVSYKKGDPNYDLFKLACKVSAKRLFPNFSNLDAPYNAQYYKEGNKDTEIAYMGCRTRVIGNVYDSSNEIVTGRGNLSFTSINLPRLAIKAGKGNIESFFAMLDEKLDLVKRQLLKRYNLQRAKHVYNYPFLMGQGVWLDSDKLNYLDEVGDILKHGSLTVGFIGLAETLIALTGHHHGESVEAQQLGLKIVGYMRAKTDEWSEKEKLNFGLIATPAEGLSSRFTISDRRKYGVIAGITDKGYYTNSFHIPVYYDISAYDKLRLEAPYHELTNGGHISYVEMDGDPLKNLSAFESIVCAMHDLGIGYGAINHPVDRDPVCGYTGIINDVCPRCGRRDGEAISEAKLAELKKRYKDIPCCR